MCKLKKEIDTQIALSTFSELWPLTITCLTIINENYNRIYFSITLRRGRNITPLRVFQVRPLKQMQIFKACCKQSIQNLFHTPCVISISFESNVVS